VKGWIALHRKLLSSPIAKKPDAMLLLIHLLLSANHKDGQFILGNQAIDIPKGSLMTGRKSLSKSTGLHQSKIQRLLLLFEKMQIIEQQTKTKYRLISIINWEQYQSIEQQLNNKRTTTEQQLNTNNNDNNVNNGNKKEERAYPLELNVPAWKEYIDYRRESKIRKLTLKGEDKQIEKIIGFGDYSVQQQCINETIANGWQGIFPPKQSKINGVKSKATNFIDRVLDDGFNQ
jgi:hypothetical protein